LFWISGKGSTSKYLLRDVAELLSEIFHDANLCVSDVLVGLILVRRRQVESGQFQFNHNLKAESEYSSFPTYVSGHLNPSYESASEMSQIISEIIYITQYAEGILN
jgi:hypothetical protein